MYTLKALRGLEYTARVQNHWSGGDIDTCHLMTVINSKVNATWKMCH